jgi:hypothetical protein
LHIAKTLACDIRLLLPANVPCSAKLEDMKKRKEDASRTDPVSGTSSKSATPVEERDHEERGDGGDGEEEEERGGRIVPKLTIGADGNVVIDEER